MLSEVEPENEWLKSNCKLCIEVRYFSSNKILLNFLKCVINRGFFLYILWFSPELFKVIIKKNTYLTILEVSGMKGELSNSI